MSGTQLGIGIGGGATGTLFSALIEQRLYQGAPVYQGAPERTLLGYAGYSAGFVSGGGTSDGLPEGWYHWIDLGLLFRFSSSRFTFDVGLGVGVVLHGPAGYKDAYDRQDGDRALHDLDPVYYVSELGYAPQA